MAEPKKDQLKQGGFRRKKNAAEGVSSGRLTSGARPFTGPFILILLVVLLVAVVTVLISQQRSYREHQARRSDLLDELARVEEESKSLASRLADVDSAEYAEQVARDELGMVRPGEIVFESPGSSRVLKDTAPADPPAK